MSDILEKLAKSQKLYEDAGVDGSTGVAWVREAAEEITRLRAENKKMVDGIKFYLKTEGWMPVVEQYFADRPSEYDKSRWKPVKHFLSLLPKPKGDASDNNGKLTSV